MARMIVHTPRCRTLESTIASTSEGSTRKKSMTRIRSAPAHPVKCPAAMPTTVPMTIDSRVATVPTSRETRAPQSRRHQDRPAGGVGAERQGPGGRVVDRVVDEGDVEQPGGRDHRGQHGEQDDDDQDAEADQAAAARSELAPHPCVRPPAGGRWPRSGDHAAYPRVVAVWRVLAVVPGWSLMRPSPSGRGTGRAGRRRGSSG